MLKIRLQRTGRKNRPAYRVVVCEHTAPVKGSFLEKVGHYDPLNKKCVIDVERVKYWTSVGAKCSETVESLISKGMELKQNSRTRIGKRKKEKEAMLKEQEKKAHEQAIKDAEEKKAAIAKEQEEALNAKEEVVSE